MVADGSAEALCRLILGQKQPGPLLFARGSSVAMDLNAELSKRGLAVVEHVVYVQEKRMLTASARSALKSRRCVVPLFSARTAQIFGEQARNLPDLGHVVVGISTNVVQKFPLDWRSVAASSPSADDMSQVVIQTWKTGIRRLE